MFSGESPRAESPPCVILLESLDSNAPSRGQGSLFRLHNVITLPKISWSSCAQLAGDKGAEPLRRNSIRRMETRKARNPLSFKNGEGGANTTAPPSFGLIKMYL